MRLTLRKARSTAPAPAPGPVPLCTLRSGSRATVCQRLMTCEECELLNAMGLTEHCVLRVCQAGEPCIIQVASTRLGLSSAMARSIMVLNADVPLRP